MAKKSPTTPPNRKFLGKYESLMEKAHAAEQRQRYPNLATLIELLDKGEDEPPRMITFGAFWEEVEQWWPIRVLRQAAEEGDREGCKSLLHFFLSELGVRLPKDVLIPFRGKRGRPNETEEIYEAWIAKGRPATTGRVCDDLAKTFYADEFAQARPYSSHRKKLRDRVRSTIVRHRLALGATKSPSFS